MLKTPDSYAAMQADIESRDRLAAAIESLTQNGVQSNISMFSRDDHRSLMKQQAKAERFAQRNGIK